IKPGAALECRLLFLNCADGVFEMEYHAVLLVQRSDEVAELSPEHPLERPFLRRNHVHVDVARAQGGRGLESDKATADDNRALCVLWFADNGSAIGERAQRMHMLLAGPRNIEPDWLSACCQQQLVKLDSASVAQCQLFCLCIERGDLGL